MSIMRITVMLVITTMMASTVLGMDRNCAFLRLFPGEETELETYKDDLKSRHNVEEVNTKYNKYMDGLDRGLGLGFNTSIMFKDGLKKATNNRKKEIFLSCVNDVKTSKMTNLANVVGSSHSKVYDASDFVYAREFRTIVKQWIVNRMRKSLENTNQDTHGGVRDEVHKICAGINSNEARRQYYGPNLFKEVEAVYQSQKNVGDKVFLRNHPLNKEKIRYGTLKGCRLMQLEDGTFDLMWDVDFEKAAAFSRGLKHRLQPRSSLLEMTVSSASLVKVASGKVEIHRKRAGFLVTKNQIDSFEPNSAGEEAGLKIDDIITKVNGKKIRSSDDLLAKLRAAELPIELRYTRFIGPRRAPELDMIV